MRVRRHGDSCSPFLVTEDDEEEDSYEDPIHKPLIRTSGGYASSQRDTGIDMTYKPMVYTSNAVAGHSYSATALGLNETGTQA